MEIGQKLKDARIAAGFTQEHIAEKLGVSRQTVSNWENNKSYPDIVSVIALSDLYSLSLDELLKEDRKMVAYLENSTNTVKSRHNFSKLMLVLAYLIIWSLLVLAYWLGFGSGSDAMGYALLVFYIILPITTLVLSVFVGKGEEWANIRWVMLLFFGVMAMLAEYSTFTLAYMIYYKTFNMPNMENLLPGIICGAIGMLIGTAVRKRRYIEKYTIKNQRKSRD